MPAVGKQVKAARDFLKTSAREKSNGSFFGFGATVKLTILVRVTLLGIISADCVIFFD
jgi:hypothetical protein